MSKIIFGLICSVSKDEHFKNVWPYIFFGGMLIPKPGSTCLLASLSFSYLKEAVFILELTATPHSVSYLADIWGSVVRFYFTLFWINTNTWNTIQIEQRVYSDELIVYPLRDSLYIHKHVYISYSNVSKLYTLLHLAFFTC